MSVETRDIVAKLDANKAPIGTHLNELKNRVVRVVGLGFIFLIIGWSQSEWLLAEIVGPTEKILNAEGFEVFLGGLMDGFWIRLKVAAFVTLFVTLPHLFIETYCFMKPALKKEEANALLRILCIFPFLLILGTTFWLAIILPETAKFMASLRMGEAKLMLNYHEFINFTLFTGVILGILFEFPLVLYFLLKIGILDLESLKAQRRMVILGVLIVSAIATPSPDAVTMILFALPLYALFEGTLLWFAWQHPSTKNKTPVHQR